MGISGKDLDKFSVCIKSGVMLNGGYGKLIPRPDENNGEKLLGDTDGIHQGSGI